VSDAPIGRPEDVVVAFVEAWNQRDPDALAALFDDHAAFVNVTGLWWHTREEIRKAHAYGLTRIFKESVLTATDVRVKWLSDEIAVVHARMTLTGQSPVDEISTPRQRSNVMSFVVHRTTEGWSCARRTTLMSFGEPRRTSLTMKVGFGRSAIATGTSRRTFHELVGLTLRPCVRCQHHCGMKLRQALGAVVPSSSIVKSPCAANC